MKKIFTLVLLLAISVTAVSCQNNGKPIEGDTPLLFSKLMTDNSLSYSGIELYNPSDQEFNLKGHEIRIYAPSSRTVDTNIKLKGKIEAKGFFYITHNESSSNAKEDSNQTYKGRKLSGSEALVLVQSGKQVDIIGSIGGGRAYININSGSTYMRKSNRLEQRQEFMPYDYLELKAGMFEKLGTLDTGITEEDLLYGPQVGERETKLPFYLNNDPRYGGGGTVIVETSSYGDGDTTDFLYPDHVNLGVMRTRYHFIDTPETQENRIEEFGYVAANFTNNLLNEATKIEIQVPHGLSTDGSFGRFFGHVYVNGYSLSYLLLKQGLADLGATAGSGVESESYYKNMRLESWMRQADYYADELDLGRYGETDPSYYYNGKDEGDNVGYRPFFIKPFERDGVKIVTTEQEFQEALNDDTKIIELANDISINKSLEIKNKTNKRIIGFGNKITTSGDSVISIIDSDFIYIENISLDGGNYAINLNNSNLFIDGFMEFSNHKETAINIVNKSNLDQGTNSTDNYKGKMYLRAMFDSLKDKPFVQSDSTSTFKTNNLFKGIKFEQTGNNWNLVVTKP